MNVDVSVAIPVKNGLRFLPEVLDAVKSQITGYRFEILAADSGSTDGSLEILRNSGARLLQIPPAQFDHGLTRNLLIEKAAGRFVVLLTQDATPTDRTWLQALVEPLEESGVAGVYGRQVPRPEADPQTRKAVESWIAGVGERRVQAMTREEYAGMHPIDRYLRCYFDNVCSAVKKNVWQEIPFRAAYFAEDNEWGRDVMLAGHRIIYEPDAAVIHSHDRSPRYEYRRTYLCHRRLYAIHGVHTIPTRRLLWRDFLSECVKSFRTAWSDGLGVGRFLSGPAYAAASTAGQYRGARDEREGRPLPAWRV